MDLNVLVTHKLLKDMAILQKSSQQKPRSWAERAFRALDTDARGYLYPEELFN
jgi:hypothetical protein